MILVSRYSILKNYDNTVRKARFREIRNVKYMTKA